MLKQLRIELADERGSSSCLPPARTTAEMLSLLHLGPADAIHSGSMGKAGSGCKQFHVNSSEKTGRLCCLESSCCFKIPSFLDKEQQLHVPHSFTPEKRLFSFCASNRVFLTQKRAVGILTRALGPVCSRTRSASELPAGTQALLTLLLLRCLPWTREPRISTD